MPVHMYNHQMCIHKESTFGHNVERRPEIFVTSVLLCVQCNWDLHNSNIPKSLIWHIYVISSVQCAIVDLSFVAAYIKKKNAAWAD